MKWYTEWQIKTITVSRHPRELSWPDDVLYVVHVDLDVFFKVNHDQTMFRSICVDDDVISEICHDQTMLCSVYVDDDVVSKVCHDQTMFSP